MEDAESKNHEEDIQKPWESLIPEKQLVTEFTKGQLVPTSSGKRLGKWSYTKARQNGGQWCVYLYTKGRMVVA